MKPMSMWFVLTCMVNFVNLFEAHAADNVFNNNGFLQQYYREDNAHCY